MWIVFARGFLWLNTKKKKKSNKEMANMDETVFQDCGFENAAEFHYLVASMDISDPKRRKEFEKWQQNDGTKAGLLVLMKNNNEKVKKP